MKKKILKISVLFSLVIIATIGTKVANNENAISSIGLMLSNVEALASDSEGGSGSRRVKHDTHGGKVFVEGSHYITYERTGVGDGCITWPHYQPLGDKNGYCYTYE